jgi:7-cyano-7-deazaguanine reductase
MPKAEGRMIAAKDHSHIQKDLLETIPYKEALQGVDQKVSYVTDEFSAVCPFSGLPDLARVQIDYIPKDRIVELKSLKYYFISYRDVGIYQEEVTNRLFKDLKELLEPKWLRVETCYRTRGGIDATCVIDSKS